MRSYTDIAYKEGLTLEMHLPDEGSFPVFIYFHGGGLYAGGTYCKPFDKTLCDHGCGIVSVQYRLYHRNEGEPQTVHYPDFLVDCADAVRWVFDHIGEYGECRGIYAGGSSAGGYISMCLCFDASHLARVGLKPLDLAGFVHDAGQPTAHFTVLKNDFGVDSRRVIVNETAPLYHIGEDEKYPPMLLIVSDQDMENRYEQTMLVLSTLRHFGHTEKDGIFSRVVHGTHCAYVYATDEDGEATFGKMVLDLIEKAEKRKA